MNGKNYITTRDWMVTDLGLKHTQKDVYGVIYGFSKDGKGVFNASLQWLANLIGCSRRSVNSAITQLLKDELITCQERNSTTGGTNVYTVNFDKIPEAYRNDITKEGIVEESGGNSNQISNYESNPSEGLQKQQMGSAKTANKGCKDCKGGLQKLQTKVNNNINKNIKDKSSSVSIVNTCMSEDGDAHTEEDVYFSDKDSDMDSANDFDRQAYRDFIQTYDIAIDGYTSELYSMDFDKLNNAYAKSRKYLQQRPYCKTLSWICRNYKRILLRYYEDYDTAPANKVYSKEEEAELERRYGGNDNHLYVDGVLSVDDGIPF